MKNNDFSIFLFLSILFAAIGIFLFSLSFEKEEISYSKVKKFENVVNYYKESRVSLEDINLDIRDRNFFFEELLQSSDPKFFQQDRYEYGAVLEKGLNCKSQNIELGSSKDKVWFQFMCHKIKELPINFFKEPPYLSSSGYSFAYLAAYSHEAVFLDEKWIKENKNYFSMPELLFNPGLRSTLSIPDFDIGNSILSQMSLLSPIVKNEDVVYLLDSKLKTKYKKFNSKDFFNYLEFEKGYLLSKDFKNCIYSFIDYCVSYQTSKDLSSKNASYKFLSFLISTLSILLFFVYFIKQKVFNKESQLRKLALDNLTHDLRTPITSMVLLSDKIDKIFNEKEDIEKFNWLELNSQIHRLRRIAEDTTHYMKSFSEPSVEVTKIPSLKDFINNYEAPEIKITFNHKIDAIYSNQYWLSVCIKNLINNAIEHGGKRIEISTYSFNKYTIINVTDSGSGLKKSFKEMSEEFIKGERSQGMGLGLSLSLRAAKMIGGSLHYQNNPTTFILKFRNLKPAKRIFLDA